MAEAQRRSTSGTTFNDAEYLQRKADRANEESGNLRGIDCAKCKNRGYITVVKNNTLEMRICECEKARKALSRMERTGIKTAIEELRFDNFKVSEEWQKEMLTVAQNYVTNGEGKWLFFGGTSGCGKTHLSTAVCGELLKQGKDVRYMMWRDEGTQLKALANQGEEYSQKIREIKVADVLYIDDFLKVQKGQKPTAADINLAFEILNYRYQNKLRTIISTELTINDILSLDDAVGGRIVQMSRSCGKNIGYDPKKNYRLRKES